MQLGLITAKVQSRLEVGGGLGREMGWPVAGASKCINQARAVAAPWEKFTGLAGFRVGWGRGVEGQTCGRGLKGWGLQRMKEYCGNMGGSKLN